MDKIAIVDTMFARFDMGTLAESELKRQPGFGKRFGIVRTTVPGIKDLAGACKRLIFDSLQRWSHVPSLRASFRSSGRLKRWTRLASESEFCPRGGDLRDLSSQTIRFPNACVTLQNGFARVASVDLFHPYRLCGTSPLRLRSRIQSTAHCALAVELATR
jgi:hypothetical protein